MSIKLSKEEVIRLDENPNNMIVSDVLKDRLPNDFYREPVDIGVVRVHIDLGGDDLSFSLSSYENQAGTYTINGTASKEDGLKLVTAASNEVRSVSILRGVNNIVKTIEGTPDTTKIAVDFTDWNGSQECIVTLTLSEDQNNPTEILNG